MPLQVNEAAINELATLTGVDAAKLKSEIVVEADAPPTETKIKDLLANAIIMPKTNYDQLLDNTRKTKFDEGKNRALNDLVKVALGDKAFEVTADMKREDAWAKLQAEARKVWEKESGTPPAEWATEKSKLQGMVTEKEQAYENLKKEIESSKENSAFERKVLSAVSAIPFEGESEIVSRRKEVVLKNILSSYTRKVEDGKDVYYNAQGQKQVDQYLNPKSIEVIVQEEAVIFPTKQAPNGRGDKSSNPNNPSGNLDADLKNATNYEALHKVLEARGLSSLTPEGQAVVRQWVAIHQKKA